MAMQRRLAAAFFVAFLPVLTNVATAQSGPVRDLTSKDRAYLEKLLGKGVIGEPLPAAPIPPMQQHVEKWLGREAIRKCVHGPDKGKEILSKLDRLKRDGTGLAWRLDTGGRTVLYGQFDSDGSMKRHSVDDREEGVLTQYAPPVPLFVPGYAAGQKAEVETKIKVFDLANPTKQEHSGKMKVTTEYLGRFRVKVPAGTFETIGMKWTYKGKVGPANVEDQSYWFFNLESGPIVWVNKLDVSAFLVYQDHSKRASVLARFVEE